MVRVNNARPAPHALSKRARSQRHPRSNRGQHAENFPARGRTSLGSKREPAFLKERNCTLHRSFLSQWKEYWGERRGLNPRPSVPQTDALPAELRSPQTKYTQFRPHSVFSKVGQPPAAAGLSASGFPRLSGPVKSRCPMRRTETRPAMDNRALPFAAIDGTKRYAATRSFSPTLSLRRGRVD